MRSLTNCKICQSGKLTLLKTYAASNSINSNWANVFNQLFPEIKSINISLAICRECGFIFYKDVFEDYEIKRLYSTEGRYEVGELRKLKPGRRRELDMLMAYLDTNVPFAKINSIIDVGAGDFEILNWLINKYPDKHYSAIDPSYVGDTFRGANVYHELLEDTKITDSFDLVMLTHVLEHVVDLNKFMKKLIPLVKKYAYIEVPFQVGPGLFLNRSLNSQHINYFSPETIRFLLEYNGLKVISLKFENDWHRYNGMPGMIRILACSDNKFLPVKPCIVSSVWHLLNPLPYLKKYIPK